jgi:hypothetical protein
MRLLLFTIFLLFTNGCVNNYKACNAQYETDCKIQHERWIAASFAIGEENISRKEDDPYDPRHDCLYRAYLAATVLGVLGGIVGVGLIFWQVILLRHTVDASNEQSKAMERHIGEATRSADAMEQIAKVILTGNKAITRAYLTVIVNSAVFQERGQLGQGDKKFQGIPRLLNTGVTTARKIRISINAGILPIPIPTDLTFPPRKAPETESQGFLSLGAHQHADLMGGIVDDFVPEDSVTRIKEGFPEALCVWGAVTYEDIFGDSHTTKFGQQLYWWPNGNVRGLYIPGQNDAD